MRIETLSYEYTKVGEVTFKIELYYDAGGESYTSSSRTVDRGYYVCVTPVKIEEQEGYTVESYEAYSGIKMNLLPVKRRSASSQNKARAMLTDTLKDDLINRILCSTRLYA